MLRLEDVQKELDEIDRTILGYSVNKELGVEELVDILAVLNKLKDSFFEISFIDKELSLLEDIRLYILESIYNVQIFMKERNGEDMAEELERLQKIEMEGGAGNE